jgi:hypothetical protein
MNMVSSGVFLTFMREVGKSSNESARSAVGESIERKFGNMPSCVATTIVNVDRFGGSNKDGLHGCGMVMFTDKWLLAPEFNLIHKFKWDSIGMGAPSDEKQCANV